MSYLTLARDLQLTPLSPRPLRPHVARPPSLRLDPDLPAAGHDVRGFPFFPPLSLAPPLERPPAASFGFRWPLPAPQPLQLSPPELEPKLPEPLAIYNFNQTQQADEPAGRTTVEALGGFSANGQTQYGYTLLGRRSWNHAALGLTSSGTLSPGPSSTSFGAVGHVWRSLVEGAEGDDDAFKLTIGAYGQGVVGSIPTPSRRIGTGTGSLTGATSLDWGWISLDVNAVGSAANRVQLNDPAQSVVGPAYGLGGSAAVTLKGDHGYSGVMLEGTYGHQWITGDPTGSVNRYGFGLGLFHNFRLGPRSLLFTGVYGNVTWEDGRLTPRGGAATTYDTPTLSGSLIFGWGR